MRSPTGPVEAQITVKGSRFLAFLAPAGDVAAARSGLAARSEQHRDATHHAWAFRVWREGRIEGAGFDAGEPAGTTDRPILGALERGEIVPALCVVSRWFGGTKSARRPRERLGLRGAGRARHVCPRAAREDVRARADRGIGRRRSRDRGRRANWRHARDPFLTPRRTVSYLQPALETALSATPRPRKPRSET